MVELILGIVMGIAFVVFLGSGTHSTFVSRVGMHLREFSDRRAGLRETDSLAVLASFVAISPAEIRDRWRHRARRRNRDVSDELPGVLDLFGLCVTAGYGVVDACGRIAQSGVGILPDECARIVAEVSVGVTLAAAVSASAERVRHDGWSRFTEHILTSRRYGTPLSDIIRSLAADERAAAGRRLLESASAKETAMLFPLVFLILPATVLIAVFPGLDALGSVTFT